MTVWRLIKKLERAAWARKYSDVLTARAELAELFGPAPAPLEEDVPPRPEGLFQFFERRIRELSAPPPVDMSGTPAGLCGVEPTDRPDYLGIDRSTYPTRETDNHEQRAVHYDSHTGRETTPMFSAKVPESSGAFTREHLQGFADLLKVPLTIDDVVAKRYVDGRLVDLREDEPMCEHGVLCAHVSAFKGCSTCGTSSQLMRPKHVRSQSDGSCDCPGEGDGRGCTWSELECRVRSYHNGRLSVRAWFRKMRAAEFREATRWPFRASHDVIPVGPIVIVGTYEPWTLFDTQAIVDRETAPHYRDTPERAAWRRLFDPFFDGTR